MRTFSLIRHNPVQDIALPSREEVETRINNKLILVRSFIDQLKGELNRRAKNEDNLDILEMARGLRKLDEEWVAWEKATRIELADPSKDPELIKFKVQDEMNQMLDKIEQYEN